MDAISRSWPAKPQDDTFILKLSTRLANTLCHGMQDGIIKRSVFEQHLDAIKGLENVALEENSENATAWKTWKTVRSGLKHYISPSRC